MVYTTERADGFRRWGHEARLADCCGPPASLRKTLRGPGLPSRLPVRAHGRQAQRWVVRCLRHRGPQPHHPQETPYHPHNILTPGDLPRPAPPGPSPGGPPQENPSTAAPAPRRLLPPPPCAAALGSEARESGAGRREPGANHRPGSSAVSPLLPPSSEVAFLAARPGTGPGLLPSCSYSLAATLPRARTSCSQPLPPLVASRVVWVRVGNPWETPRGEAGGRGSGVAGSRGGGKEPRTPLFGRHRPHEQGTESLPSMERGRAPASPPSGAAPAWPR